MPNIALHHRQARPEDLGALRSLMDAAISELQKPFLDDRQIASSRTGFQTVDLMATMAST
jgi:hypothetical protein